MYFLKSHRLNPDPKALCRAAPYAVIGAVIATLALFTAPATLAQQRSAASIEWIDVHVHPIGGRGRYTDYPSAVNAAVAAMAEARISKMVLMPPPQAEGAAAPFDYEHFAAAVKTHGSRLAFLGGGGSLNVMIQQTGEDPAAAGRMRSRFEQKAQDILGAGALGFGEITAHHLSLIPGHPYESVPADHPLLLLLADIAARNDAVIDFHFDPVVEDMRTPDQLAGLTNPPLLRANLAAFERLLEHNRGAKIVWAHAGSDMLGQWTVALSRSLLQKHPNLYMSLRMSPGRAPRNHPLTPAGQVKPEWLELLADFSDRFVIGGDQFFASPTAGSGPGSVFAQRSGMMRERINLFLSALPEALARKIASENARRIYKLQD